MESSKRETAKRASSPATKGNEEHSLERHPVSVLIHDEDVGMILAHSWMHIPSGGSEEAAGHGWKFKAGEFHQGEEGQVYVMSVEREGGEGQMSRGSFLRWMDPRDTEGEGSARRFSIPRAPKISRLRGSGRASSGPT